MALQLGRRGLGCDVSENYLALARKRLEAAQERVDMPLFDTPEPEAAPLSLFDEEP